MTNKEKSFIELNQIEALELLKKIKAEAFRYEQIQNWIFDNFIENWDQMENIPKDLRDKLSNNLLISSVLP